MLLVAMSVMNIRIMRVGVHEFAVNVRMGVGCARESQFLIVLVPVVLVMAMAVVVNHFFMAVFVGMVLGQVNPYTNAHEKGANKKRAVTLSLRMSIDKAAPTNGAIEK